MNSRSSRSFLSGPAEGAQALNTGMTSKQEPSEHGALVANALNRRAQEIAERADERIAKARDERTGQYLAKMSDDDWAKVLERVEAGDILANICREFGITNAAINSKRKRDPEFSEAYEEAIFNGFINVAHNIRAVTRGIAGYGHESGDPRRDELIAKYDFELAKKLASRVLGDKLQIDQRNLTIMLDSDFKDI